MILASQTMNLIMPKFLRDSRCHTRNPKPYGTGIFKATEVTWAGQALSRKAWKHATKAAGGGRAGLCRYVFLKTGLSSKIGDGKCM